VGSILDRLPPGSPVAVLRLRSLGDCVLTTPALDLLRAYRPDLQIAVVVEDRFREIFASYQTVTPKLGSFRRVRPRLCLNLHGGTRSAWMTALSGAPLRAGFGHFRNGFVYNISIPRAQEILGVDRTVHTAEHLASAMFYLGVPVQEIPRANIGAAARTATPPYCVIHPVAATPSKTWPASHFLTIAEYLRTNGIEPVFIGAATDDLTPFSGYRTLQGSSLTDVKALLSAASLFLGNDSGPAHMAAAFGLPVVVLFGDSDPAIWGPWRTASEILRHPSGIAHIPPAAVVEALARLRVHA
jgi:heptosyltransferase-3